MENLRRNEGEDSVYRVVGLAFQGFAGMMPTCCGSPFEGPIAPGTCTVEAGGSLRGDVGGVRAPAAFGVLHHGDDGGLGVDGRVAVVAEEGRPPATLLVAKEVGVTGVRDGEVALGPRASERGGRRDVGVVLALARSRRRRGSSGRDL